MALESAHKDRKDDHLDHTRKTGRFPYMEDIYWRAFDMSDPILLHTSLKQRVASRKVLKYPREVTLLFENFECLVDEEEVEVDIVAQIFDNMPDSDQFVDMCLVQD